MPAAAVKLSCERCRRRKTKCNKENPCANCKDAGISCTGIERARLPRGPSGKVKNRNSVLATRVARLEHILKQVAGQIQPSSDDTNHPKMFGTPESANDLHTPPVDKLGQFYAKDIWSTLSEEVTGLRETLEASDEEEESTEAIEKHDSNRIPSGALSNRFLFGRSSSNDDSLDPPSQHMRYMLLRLYQDRVDCLFKITHWPTIVSKIEMQYNDGYYRPLSPSVQALEFSIYFLAMCSISDQESQEMFLENRQTLLERYRVATEISISTADLLNNPDLTNLQAFIIYLNGIRSCMQYTASWTLLATAARVATALGLPVSETEGWSAYDLETRRRLWFGIRTLDLRTAADRGYVPLISYEDTSSPPLLTPDSELASPAVPMLPQSDTDMSLVYVYREVSTCFNMLFTHSFSPEDGSEGWHTKLRILADFRDSMEQHSVRINDPTNPFRICAQFSTIALAKDMELFLRRPPFRVKNNKPPAWDDYDILARTTEILELNLTKPVNTTFAPWAWFAKPWVRWYILAVLLTELCIPREGELAERAYKIAKESLARYGELIADTDLRTVWKPLIKLMRYVDQVRQSAPSASLSLRVGASEAAASSDSQIVSQPVKPPASISRVVMSYDIDAREKVMEWASTKDKSAADNVAETWNEDMADWQLGVPDVKDDAIPSNVWDSFLDDLGGYNRCFM
jgi:hypothetical protein